MVYRIRCTYFNCNFILVTLNFKLLTFQPFFISLWRFPEISIDGKDHNREFKIGCSVGQRQCFGVGSTKREARQIAAQTMLNMIDQNYDKERACTSSNCSVKSLQSSNEDVSILHSQLTDTTCISKLIAICQQNYLKMPEYVFIYSWNLLIVMFWL